MTDTQMPRRYEEEAGELLTNFRFGHLLPSERDDWKLAVRELSDKNPWKRVLLALADPRTAQLPDADLPDYALIVLRALKDVIARGFSEESDAVRAFRGLRGKMKRIQGFSSETLNLALIRAARFLSYRAIAETPGKFQHPPSDLALLEDELSALDLESEPLEQLHYFTFGCRFAGEVNAWSADYPKKEIREAAKSLRSRAYALLSERHPVWGRGTPTERQRLLDILLASLYLFDRDGLRLWAGDILHDVVLPLRFGPRAIAVRDMATLYLIATQMARDEESELPRAPKAGRGLPRRTQLIRYLDAALECERAGMEVKADQPNTERLTTIERTVLATCERHRFVMDELRSLCFDSTFSKEPLLSELHLKAPAEDLGAADLFVGTHHLSVIVSLAEKLGFGPEERSELQARLKVIDPLLQDRHGEIGAIQALAVLTGLVAADTASIRQTLNLYSDVPDAPETEEDSDESLLDDFLDLLENVEDEEENDAEDLGHLLAAGGIRPGEALDRLAASGREKADFRRPNPLTDPFALKRLRDFCWEQFANLRFYTEAVRAKTPEIPKETVDRLRNLALELEEATAKRDDEGRYRIAGEIVENLVLIVHLAEKAPLIKFVLLSLVLFMSESLDEALVEEPRQAARKGKSLDTITNPHTLTDRKAALDILEFESATRAYQAEMLEKNPWAKEVIGKTKRILGHFPVSPEIIIFHLEGKDDANYLLTCGLSRKVAARLGKKAPNPLPELILPVPKDWVMTPVPYGMYEPQAPILALIQTLSALEEDDFAEPPSDFGVEFSRTEDADPLFDGACIAPPELFRSTSAFSWLTLKTRAGEKKAGKEYGIFLHVLVPLFKEEMKTHAEFDMGLVFAAHGPDTFAGFDPKRARPLAELYASDGLIAKEELKPLVPAPLGDEPCYVSKKITDEGLDVGVLVRAETRADGTGAGEWALFPAVPDTGAEQVGPVPVVNPTTFISPETTRVLTVNAAANYDPSILPYLNGTSFAYVRRLDGPGFLSIEEAYAQKDERYHPFLKMAIVLRMMHQMAEMLAAVEDPEDFSKFTDELNRRLRDADPDDVLHLRASARVGVAGPDGIKPFGGPDGSDGENDPFGGFGGPVGNA